MKFTFTIFHANRDAFHSTIFGEVLPLDNYDKVSVFSKAECSSLDHCFIHTQNISTNWCNPPKRSTSVGDLIRDDDTGHYHMVDSCGFKDLGVL